MLFLLGKKDCSRAFVSRLYLTLCLRKLVFGLGLLLDHAVSRYAEVIVDLTIIEFCKGSKLSHEGKVDHRGFCTLG